MSIFEYNGSAVVAMVGKNCFAIASDRRLGVQLQTIATDFQKIFQIHDRLFLGLSGLGTDMQTLYQRLVFRHKLYQLREERDMKPETFASVVLAILYEKREISPVFEKVALLYPTLGNILEGYPMKETAYRRFAGPTLTLRSESAGNEWD
ncbi:Proteasome subunit beta type-3-A-like protein [Drosera capensis]